MCLWFRNDKVGNGDYDVIMILRNVARGPFLIFLWAITVPFMFTHPSLCMYLTKDYIKSYSCHVCWRPTSFPSIDRIITTIIIIIIHPFQFKWRISLKWRAAHSLLVAAGVFRLAWALLSAIFVLIIVPISSHLKSHLRTRGKANEQYYYTETTNRANGRCDMIKEWDCVVYPSS